MHSTHETLQTAPHAEPDDLDGIALELERANRAVVLLVGRIDDAEADGELLDELTEQIVTVLARVEQLRCARAWLHAKASRDEARWVDYLDVA